jgi:hypothetical protein
MFNGPTWIPVAGEISSEVSMLRTSAPNSSSAVLWRKNDIPSAVISGAMRGASRSGR